MAKVKQCCHNEDMAKIETLTLDDGRKAERHITYDDQGNEIVEIFAEEKRPLKLEKRIVREYKNIVSKETHETIRDGEVTLQEVRSLEPEVPLQVRQRVGVADHAKVIDGDYVKKQDIDRLIADGVVAGITAIMDKRDIKEPVRYVEPEFRMQSVVEKNVEEKNKSGTTFTVIVVAIIAVQLVAFAYIYTMM